MGIYVRELRDEELRAEAVEGRWFRNNLPQRLNGNLAETPIPIDRLRRESLLKALNLYAGLFIEQVADEASGEVQENDQTPRLRETLAEAWDEYRNAAASADDPANPKGFREFLSAQPDRAEALNVLDSLGSLIRELNVMGLTRLEIRASMNHVLGSVTTRDLTQRQLEAALGVEGLG